MQEESGGTVRFCRGALQGGSACRHQQVSRVHTRLCAAMTKKRKKAEFCSPPVHVRRHKWLHMEGEQSGRGTSNTWRESSLGEGRKSNTGKGSSLGEGRATAMSNAIFNDWRVAQIPEKTLSGLWLCSAVSLFWCKTALAPSGCWIQPQPPKTARPEQSCWVLNAKRC